jgi:hypothetical protein
MKRFIAKSWSRWVLACDKEYTPTPKQSNVLLVQMDGESFLDFELRCSKHRKEG